MNALGVGIFGADGTGKSTLVHHLKAHYGSKINIIQEVARRVIDAGYPLGKDAHPESYQVLMQAQISEMLAKLDQGLPFVSDRTLLDQYCYSRVNSTLPRPSVRQIHIDLNETVWRLEKEFFRFYFYVPIEFEIEDDGIRENDEEYQEEVDSMFKKIWYENNLRVISLTGTKQERAVNAIEVINEEFSKEYRT